MISVSQWWAAQHQQHKPWLLLGKGPSLDQQPLPDLAHYWRLALNHAVTRQPVHLASVVDLEVLQDCAHAIRQNAYYLLMPRHPHRDFRPTPEPLEQHFKAYPLLSELDAQGRLLWYNFFNAPAHPSAPVVPRGRFSAQVMVNLLALLGVRQIRTLGVDGGLGYAKGFDVKHHLANRHSSFDVQWQGIAHTVHRYRIDYAPVGLQTPLRVKIISDPPRQLAAQVLAYSLRQYHPTRIRYEAPELLPTHSGVICLDAASLMLGYHPGPWHSTSGDPSPLPLLRFQDPHSWPWRSRQHPQETLWVQTLRDGLLEGAIPWRVLEQAIRQGFARPSLKLQLNLPQRYWSLLQPVLGPLLD